MRILPLAELAKEQIHFDTPEVFPEVWTTRKSFALYKSTPRPCSALFYVKREIRAHFYPQAGERITARKGDVVYIPEGSLYHVQIEGGVAGGIDTYTINHTLRDEWGEKVLLANGITLLCERTEGALDMHFQKLSEAVHHAAGNLRICSCTYGLLDALVTAADGESNAYYAIRAGVERLREEWFRNEKIEVYAALCGMSNAYFYRLFRAWSGQSPIEYRNTLRLSQAEAMLRNTDMQIKEIAETVGFEDSFYFSRVFAQYFGVSPKKYRNGANFTASRAE